MAAKAKLWAVSAIAGCLISAVFTLMMRVTGLSYLLPGAQPGWILAWAVGAIAPSSSAWAEILVTIGNAIFYGWLSLKVMSAEMEEHGPFGRFLFGHGR